MPTVGETLEAAERELKASPLVEHPHRGKERVDADELMGFVVGNPFDPDVDLSPSAVGRFRRLLDRRLTGEPVGYIIGSTEFRGLTVRLGPGAFIPRQSSEWLADQAIRRLRARRDPVHVDLATGVGPVALAVAAAVPGARVFGADISPEPLRWARRNVRALGLLNATFVRGDLFAPLPGALRGGVDAITVHPPYVGKRQLKELPHEVLSFEPPESLTDGSPLGTRILRRVADEAPAWLRPSGWVLVEVSPDRAREVATVLRRAGFADVRSTRGGVVQVSRVVVGRA